MADNAADNAAAGSAADSEEVRVCVLVAASRGAEHDALKRCVCAQLRHAGPGLDVDLKFVYGDERPDYATDHDVYYDDVPETQIPGVLDKTMRAFRAIDKGKRPYDYVIRTTLSCWFNWDQLRAFLGLAPRRGLAAGYSPDYSHYCGCALVFTPDVVGALVQFDPQLDRTLRDDLALSEAVDRLGVAPCWLPRIDVTPDGVVGHGAELGLEPLHSFVVRVKTGDRARDASIMRRLTDAGPLGDPLALLKTAVSDVD